MPNDKKNNLFSWMNFFKKKKNQDKLNLNNKKKSTENLLNTINNNNNYKNNFLNNIQLSINNFTKNFKLKIKNLFFSNKIDDIFFKQLKETLLKFDFGYFTASNIVNHLINQYKNNILKNEKDVYIELKRKLSSIVNIDCNDNNILLQKKLNYPYVILVVGVNGVGKTTTIAKLAYFYKKLGKSIVLSASDTFRAAAIEQLEIWGQRLSIPVFQKSIGSDPSSVIFDSIEFAISNNSDILIIDTAGRLHNKIHLMEELKKNVRVIKKKIFSNPYEILLVLDSCSGQNTIVQTELFNKQLKKINGLVLTKLDGTAKGGIIFSILEKFPIPIKYVGTGEKLKDFDLFDSKKFIDNMFEV